MKKNKILNILILLTCLIVPYIFVACENKNKDTLSTPSIVDVRAGTIVFSQVPDADYYTLSLNNIELNVYVKHNSNVEIIDNLINYDASKIFVLGDSYSVKVKANSSSKANSKYSEVVSYKHMGSIKTPTEVKISSTTLTWGAVENASYYLVKIVTPNDKNIVDKLGNPLSLDDPESISKADLTEYSFNLNRFDFASLLTTAGNYQFYVCSVLSNGSTYVESGYSSKISYYNYVDLSTPINGEVKKVESDFHLTMAIDPNANAISIVCNGIEKTAEINEAEQSITKLKNNGLEIQNYIDVNLNKFFKESPALDGDQFTISTQAKYLVANSEFDFYNDSAYSNSITFGNSNQLVSPIVEATKVGSNYSLSWSNDETNNISCYKLFLFTTSGVETFELLPSINNMLITKEFISASVQAVGKGNYNSSSLSNFVCPEDATNSLSGASIDVSGNLIQWTSYENASYVLEINNQIYFLNNNQFEILQNMINSKEFSFKLHVIKEGYKPSTNLYNANLNTRLATPTFSESQGFKSLALYELTFTGSANAIGYYVYIKSDSSAEYMQIDKLFTSTKINLAQYITTAGEYTNYSVKVQAVADYYGLFVNSELSVPVQVSHAQTLETPNFHETNKIIKQVSGNTTKYFLQFYGVESADTYEILINFNRLSVEQNLSNPTGLYKVDITSYLSAANNYEIKLRAIAPVGLVNVKDSEYSTTTYTLTKQLVAVENIHVNENDGIYTLSFDPIENAEKYRVRIVKENDNSYMDYLNSLGLSTSFEVSHAVDVSQYVKQEGVYCFYITALAPKNSYYADANESSTYGIINKLTSLEKPKDIIFNNNSSTEYILSWTGDNNADYYLVKIVDPNKLSNEFKVYNSTNTNINKYISVQGTYDISIYSMVDSLGENAKSFTSSSASSVSEYYVYENKHDFLRHSVTMYGETHTFVITNVQDLKNLLWYHYLYEINENIGLNIYIEPQTIVQEGEPLEEPTVETLRQAIIRFADEASNTAIYNYNEKFNFGQDEQWLNLVSNQTVSDSDLISYLSKKLLLAYPEFNVLDEVNFSVDHSNGSNIFNLKYKNLLNGEKQDYNNNYFSNKNYGNDYSYIDLHSRKSVNSTFKIDLKNSMLVTTTEQLLHAVENGYKPLFVGDSEIAEKVYSNAKLVLSAIITNNMTDLEKVTAIFDWLEYGFDLAYFKDSSTKNHITNSFESSNLLEYGKYKLYYLEGIFENLTMKANGDIEITNNLATSQSYSKAFSLLCAIEGIEAVTINGTYTYNDLSAGETTINHVWNKVYLDTSIGESEGKKWYAVDLTYSDNKINFNNLAGGYGISSHSYFLVSDSVCENNLNVSEESDMISYSYYLERLCETTYNYYANSSFAMSYDQIKETIPENLFKIYGNQYTCEKCSHQVISNQAPTICTNCQEESTFSYSSVLLTKNFRYSKEYNSDETYQQYNQTVNGYGKPQAFMLNTIIYAGYNAKLNNSNRSVFEFNFKWANNSDQPFNQDAMFEEVFNDAKDLYGLNANLIGNIYKIQNNDTRSTIIIFIVEKSA